MRTFIDALRMRSALSKPRFFRCTTCAAAVVAFASLTAFGQSPSPQPENPAAQPPAPQAAPAQAPAPADSGNPAKSDATQEADKNPTLSAGAFSLPTVGGEIKEDQLKQMLVGKTLYLRSGYQDNNLEFDEQGRLTSHSSQGSFTLSQIQVNKVKLSKHKLELDGDRYALHFLGAAPYEDPTKATDRVKITPKKKTVRIAFDREQVETPKKKKEKNKDKDHQSAKAAGENQPKALMSTSDDSSASSQTIADSSAKTSAAAVADDHSRSEGKKGATTTSPAHASQLLLAALDKVLSQGIDDRMVGAMPDFWKLYYQAAQARADIKPVGGGIYSESSVDQKAKLISVLDPPSNEFAQANGVAGIAMYHAIVGRDGKVEAVAAGRPIGFGLDESAEQTIRKAVFQPAVKDGKPVPVALDLVVSFRIYSKRTSAPAPQEAADDKGNQPARPGPYSVQAEETSHAAEPNQTAQPPQATPTPQ